MTYGAISFPSLGIKINPAYELTIGNFVIRYYGLIIAAGLLLACIYGLRRRKEFGLTQDEILDGALMIIPFAILCARAYYCIFSWADYAANPIKVLYIWEGGLAIYGGVIGAVVGIVVYCLVKKIPITTCLDITLSSFFIGQAVGRWGNFFNREAFGAETDFFLRMGLENSLGVVTYHHPTFLYESVWNILGFVVLHFLSKRRQYDGQVALGYALWYGLGRTLIEGLRTDSLYWGPFRVSQLLAAASCLVAAGILIWQMFRNHPKEKLYVNRVAAREAAKAAEEAAEAEEVEEAAEPAEEIVEETADEAVEAAEEAVEK